CVREIAAERAPDILTWRRWPCHRVVCYGPRVSRHGRRMMLTRRRFAQAAGATLLAAPAFAQAAFAQAPWPSRPIHILVGYPAGGGVDLIARLLAEPMKATL